MADDVRIEVAEIKSNVDNLSAHAVHDTLVSFIRHEAVMGEIAMKTLVPKREFDMAAHVGHTGPYDEGIEITASVGIPEIHKADESSDTSAMYPIFVDQGTGIFSDDPHTIFPQEKKFMYLPPSRGGGVKYPPFLRETKGQKGRHFTAATFSTMVAMLDINGEAFRAELTEKLKADQAI